MSEAKHMNGPWFVSDELRHLDGRSGMYRRVLDGDWMGGNIVAFVCARHPLNHELNVHGEANARLIAAAPELLEAAQEALIELYRISPSVAAPKLRAAIAKATTGA